MADFPVLTSISQTMGLSWSSKIGRGRVHPRLFVRNFCWHAAARLLRAAPLILVPIDSGCEHGYLSPQAKKLHDEKWCSGTSSAGACASPSSQSETVPSASGPLCATVAEDS